jgi:hypothetical protein
VRYALSRAWLGVPPPAHLRGHNTAATFEAHYKGFKQSTSKRLRYYKAHLAPRLSQLQLVGVYRATEQDSNREFYTALLHACHGTGTGAAAAGPPPAAQQQLEGAGPGGYVLPGLIGDPAGAAPQQLGPADVAYYRALLRGGYGMYAGGLSHQQFIDVGGKAALTAAGA